MTLLNRLGLWLRERPARSMAMLRQSAAIILLALSSPRLEAQQLPRIPFAARGACPFECCQLGHWQTHDTLPVFARERASAPPLFSLLPSQDFLADSADFYTLALGVILVRRPLRLSDYLAENQPPQASAPDSGNLMGLRQLLAAGDTVYLIGEVSEVGERVWTHGRTVTVGSFWAEPGVEDAGAPAILLRPIVHEWWVHINAQGRRGWIQAWERNLEGTDACA